MGWRICVGENALGFEIEEFRIALVAQDQRLFAVADENQRVMRNSKHRDILSIANSV